MNHLEADPHQVFRAVPEHETAKLRLAILKENFDFRDFYERLTQDKDTPYSICPELRRPGETTEDYESRVHLLQLKGTPFFGGKAGLFGVHEFFLSETQADGRISTDDLMALFDPVKGLEDVPDILAEKIPLLFSFCVVKEFGRSYGLTEGSFIPNFEELILWCPSRYLGDSPRSSGLPTKTFGELAYRRYHPWLNTEHLKPFERIMKIDLRAKKVQIMKAIEEFLNTEIGTQAAGIRVNRELEKSGTDFRLQNAEEWFPDISRVREEAWQQLRVWKLRRDRNSFKDIARKLKISPDKAKKAFYRAYELTQAKTYDPELLKPEVWRAKQKDIQKTCNLCEKRESCNKLCPDMLRIVDQDELKSPREKWLKEDTEMHKDYLQQSFAGAVVRSTRHQGSDAQFSTSKLPSLFDKRRK